MSINHSEWERVGIQSSELHFLVLEEKKFSKERNKEIADNGRERIFFLKREREKQRKERERNKERREREERIE